MVKKLFFFCLSVISLTLFSHEDVSIYVENHIHPTNPTHNIFISLLGLMNIRNSKVIVETKATCCRDQNFYGSSESTIIFGDWAYNHDASMYSVSINADLDDLDRGASAVFSKNQQFVTKNSVDFLTTFNTDIDVLYLDSGDWDFANPLPGQFYCLNEIKAAYNKLHNNSIVIINDCNIVNGGKGKLAIKFLMKKGWRRYRNKQQVILIKKWTKTNE